MVTLGAVGLVDSKGWGLGGGLGCSPRCQRVEVAQAPAGSGLHGQKGKYGAGSQGYCLHEHVSEQRTGSGFHPSALPLSSPLLPLKPSAARVPNQPGLLLASPGVGSGSGVCKAQLRASPAACGSAACEKGVLWWQSRASKGRTPLNEGCTLRVLCAE